MDFLGIGPLELILVFVIILLVLGPKEMVKAGETIGSFIRKVMKSDGWKALQTASREIRTMPNRLAREAGIKEFQNDLKKEAKSINPLEGIDMDAPDLDAWKIAPQNIAEEYGDEDDTPDPPELEE